MNACGYFLALALGAMLGGCARSTPVADRDLVREAAVERANHAARCLNLTRSIASLPDGDLREQADDFGLAKITPDMVTRWSSVWERAAADATLTPLVMARTLRRNAVTIKNGTDLRKLVDDAFECGSTVDVTPRD